MTDENRIDQLEKKVIQLKEYGRGFVTDFNNESIEGKLHVLGKLAINLLFELIEETEDRLTKAKKELEE